jgi:L-seryl-tRNA(Ser) seleniumtransferase
LCELTGAEAATVVNNNAAATVLVLNTLAKGKEIIVSRGQLVEIGGAFRMPDVMETSGAVMKEVGTTNKTHLRDYAEAINEETGAILRVHHSNFRIVGFFEEPPIEDLVKLGREHNIPVIDDLGSGALVDLSQFELESEPLVTKSIEAGVSVSCFSGDKLVGGPQSGVIVGKEEWIKKIRKNPLARAFRIGKMTIAGMEATLKLFLDGETLTQRHPIYRMFAATHDELKKRSRSAARKLKNIPENKIHIIVTDSESQIGSGSVPTETLPTSVLCLSPLEMSSEALAKRLRLAKPPIFTRVFKDSVLMDFRTILPGEDTVVVKTLLDIFESEDKP